MFKFVHIADVHFDAPLTGKNPELRKDLKRSQREAFGKVIDFSLKEEVDGLIIAGDLFDNERLSLETEKFLMESLHRLREKNIHVFYAPGNHDPVIQMKMKFEDHVHLFDREIPMAFVIKDKKNRECHILGVGHVNEREQRNLIQKFPRKKKDQMVIGVAHTMVENVSSDPKKGKYLPTTLEDLLAKDYDYWALGHIHQRHQFKDHPVYYSGALQGLNISETGMKGGNLITIGKSGVAVEFVPFNTLYFEQLTLDISGEYSSDYDFYSILKGLIREEIEKVEYPASKTIYRIGLKGRTNQWRYLKIPANMAYLEEELSRDLGLKSLELNLDEVLPEVDFEELVMDNGILKEVMALIEAPQEDGKLMKTIGQLKTLERLETKDSKALLGEREAVLKGLIMEYFAGGQS
jgi:DNA repair exonuclease SbcCD nuclease subunit